MFKRRGLQANLRRTVIAHTRDGKSIRGILAQEYRDSVVLAQPEYLNETNPIDLGGEVLILLANVSIVQIVSVPEA